MMSELKPCPCCNTNDWLYSQPQFFKVAEQHSTPIGWVTMCNKCGVKVEKYSKEECEEVWNTRPIEDALLAEIDRLRKALEKIVNHCRPQRGSEEMALDWIEHEARETLKMKE